MSQYARNVVYGELLVISVDRTKGVFTAKDLRYGSIYTNLKIADFYFYEFC